MFVMQDLRFRILTLCVVPFLIGSGLVLLTALISLQSQTDQAEQQLAETLLTHKAPDAALYLATEDWIALAVILDQLAQATGMGRAEVLSPDNRLVLVSGKDPASRAKYTASLEHEGLIIGKLSLIVNQAPSTAAIRVLLIQTLCMITAITIVIGFTAWKFGDFILIWLSLKFGQKTAASKSVVEQISPPPDSAVVAIFSIKLDPARLVPFTALKAAAGQHFGKLTELQPGDYEVHFQQTDPARHGLEFFEAMHTQLEVVTGLNIRMAFAIDQAEASEALGKRVKYLASLSRGALVLDEQTKTQLAHITHPAFETAPLSSSFASDLVLHTLTMNVPPKRV
tara:strand:- start:187 stop:1206 length:1020 start_codon:yes stop_codon:yes gene_type:complete